jgi:hypothetical protein
MDATPGYNALQRRCGLLATGLPSGFISHGRNGQHTSLFPNFVRVYVSVPPQTCWRTLGTRVFKCVFARAPQLVFRRPSCIFILPTQLKMPRE